MSVRDCGVRDPILHKSAKIFPALTGAGDHLVQPGFAKQDWCGREDSNFHGLSPTTTSTLRVYQFRHGRTLMMMAGMLRLAGRHAPVAKLRAYRNG